MAICIPADGGIFNVASDEKSMFEALKKALPENDFYIFHSYHVNELFNNCINENEIDFIIYNLKYGCLFIEAKNRRLGYDKGMSSWYYLDKGKKVKMQNPFEQVFTAQHNLFNVLSEKYNNYEEIYKNALKHCKSVVSVWLPLYTSKELEEKDLGPSAIKELLLSKDHLKSTNLLREKIISMMENVNRIKIICTFVKKIEDASYYKNKLTFEEGKILLNEMLLPNISPSVAEIKRDLDTTYFELLTEQSLVLDFLKYQRTAAISGCSGTGKTVIAVEHAKRLAKENKKVLFLCYNKNLQKSLYKQYGKNLEKNVLFSTIDSFACKTLGETDSSKVSYHDFAEVLMKSFMEHTFEYKHIIIDEGQDFGRAKIDESKISIETDDKEKSPEDEKNILQLFCEYGSGKYYGDADTSFYIFYDKNQLVNSAKVPDYLDKVESKLTLYKNCRNTKNIAITAFSSIKTDPIMFDKAWDGDLPVFIFYNDHDDFMDKLSKISKEISFADTMLISCSSEYKNSELSIENKIFNREKINYLSVGGKKLEIFTAATCKGLEEYNVIITDVTAENFSETNKALYVAASRAKQRLYILIKRSNIDSILETEFFSESMPEINKEFQIANELSGEIKKY